MFLVQEYGKCLHNCTHVNLIWKKSVQSYKYAAIK